MKIDCLQFRWINASCYEFILPDGRVITTDPFLDRGDAQFGLSDLLTPDYIFCTHTHFDHIMEIGELIRRSDRTKLFVSEVTASVLANHFGINFGQVYALASGRRLTVEGVDILPTQGKHSRFQRRERENLGWLATAAEQECGVPGMEELMLLGSMIYTDYTLTLPQGPRLFLTGGDKTYSVPYETSREQAPLLVIRQVSNLASPEEYADIVSRLGGRLVLPHHQEHPEKRLGMSMEEFTERANRRLKEIAPGMVMLNPKQYQWYQLSLSAVPLEKN